MHAQSYARLRHEFVELEHAIARWTATERSTLEKCDSTDENGAFEGGDLSVLTSMIPLMQSSRIMPMFLTGDDTRDRAYHLADQA